MLYEVLKYTGSITVAESEFHFSENDLRPIIAEKEKFRQIMAEVCGEIGSAY